MFRRKDRIEVKTPEQILLMREAGLVVGRTLELLRESVRPGISTRELDALAEESIRSHGAVPSFLGYHGYPASICTSVNDEVVHGIPGDRVLQDGDQISIDCGAILSGWHGDAAITVGVGDVDAASLELSRVTEEALWRGLAAAVAGGSVRDIGVAVESSVRSQPAGESYGIVEEYVGHGIGTSMHMEPNVPNYDHGGKSPQLVVGMALAVEPMVCAGSRHTRTLADDWTVVTTDGGRACHWEHTVAVTAEGPWVLTAIDGGAARFAELGVASPAATRH
ncbi:MAG: type I methionyl aminopeptidase [Actinobacteria bacterium]|jgi:methionyl aminopeptidase|nr:type I methionyl aminopeptidase [Actinomycetota bacterium]